MSSNVPESHVDLLEGPVFVSLSTLMPDGQPQVTVVWCTYDGTHVQVNTTRERQKAKNMQARPKATVLAVDPENPYRYVEVRGSVDEVTEDGALDHINELAQLYMDVPEYYGHLAPAERKEKDVRVVCKIRPTRVRTVDM